MTTHRNPAEHFAKAEELLDTVQTLTNSMTGPVSVHDARYVDTFNTALLLSNLASAHAALAAAGPTTASLARMRLDEKERAALHAAMRDRANEERESAGLPREDEDARRRAYVDRQNDPAQEKTNQYIARLEVMVADLGHYGQKEQEAMRLLKSDDKVERGRGRTAAALLLGDLR